MPSTHLCLYYHLVFSVKDRLPLIADEWRARCHAFLGGTIAAIGGQPLSVGGVETHAHLLARLKATHRLCDVLGQVKSVSSRWVHEVIGLQAFAWQDGYGAFTVSPSQVDPVRRYIANQTAHHRTVSFEEEYLRFPHQAGVEYDERYLW